MARPKLRDIPYIYDGEFYIEAEGISSLRDRTYNTREILSGEDSLPVGYLDNEIMIFPWDSSSVIVLVRSH